MRDEVMMVLHRPTFRSRAARAVGAIAGALALGAPAGCGPSTALSGWTDAELCGPGAIELDAALIPAPLVVRKLGPATRLRKPRLARGEQELAVPSIDRVAKEAGLETAGAGSDAGLLVHTLGSKAVAEIERRCRVTFPSGDEGYFAAVRSSGPGAFEALLAAKNERGAARASALLLQLLAHRDGGATIREAAILDGPAQGRRGVLEGFYGPTWSFDERLEMVRFIWRSRMNVFVWSPKGDFTSRILWRFDYDAALLRELSELVAEGRRLSVDVCLMLSPGNGILYGDPDERRIVLAKLRTLAATGATCLALAFDDISRDLRMEDATRYSGAGLGAAQADLINEVYGTLWKDNARLDLGMVPTDYWTKALEEHPEYAGAVRSLPPKVFIGWTGQEVVSPVVTRADVDKAGAIWGRPVFMGDNYPVVDAGRANGRLQLGPVIAREPGAVRAVSGWVANAMPLPLASEIPLWTIADLAWNPEGYDPAASWQKTLARVAGAERAALERFAENARASLLDPSEAEPLRRHGAAWLERFPADDPELFEYLKSLADLEPHLARLGPLGREIEPWTKKLAAYGAAGIEAMDLASARRRHEPIDQARLALLERTRDQLAASPVKIGGDAGKRLLEGAITKLRAE